MTEDATTTTTDGKPAEGGTGEASGGATTATTTTTEGASGTDGAGGTGSGDGTSTTTETWDEDRAKRTIQAQRDAEKKLKADLKAAQDKAAELERKSLTEDERKEADRKAATDRAEKLEREVKELRTRSTFTEAALDAGIPAKRLKAAQAIAELDVDDDGKISNLAEAIDSLKSDHDYLFTEGSGGGGGGKKQAPAEGGSNAGSGSGGSGNDGKSLTPEELEIVRRIPGMTPEKYLANKE